MADIVYKLPSCCRLIKARPKFFAAWAAFGAAASLLLSVAARDVIAIPVPENSSQVVRVITRLPEGGHDFAIHTRGVNPVSCIRFRSDVLLQTGGEIQGIPLGTTVNGKISGAKIGYDGTFAVHYYVPSWVHGTWRSETRQVYICPVLRVFPILFVSLNTAADVVFP